MCTITCEDGGFGAASGSMQKNLYSGEELEAILAQEDDPLVHVGERLVQLQQFIDRELPEDKAGSTWRTVFGNRKQKERQKVKK